MKLFHVQDSDRPMYVIAEGWTEALLTWQGIVSSEADEASDTLYDPDGIAFMADEDELVVDSTDAKTRNDQSIEMGHLKTERNILARDLDKSNRALKKTMEALAWTRDALAMTDKDDYKQSIITFSHMIAAYRNYITAKASTKQSNAQTIGALTMRCESLARELKCCIGTIHSLAEQFDVDEIRQDIESCLKLNARTSCGDCKTGCSMPKQVELLRGIATNALLTSAKRQVPL